MPADVVPDPINCTVEPWNTFQQALVSPGTQSGIDVVTITVLDMAENPIDQAFVEIDFNDCPELCIEGSDPGLTGLTGPDGVIVMDPLVGGCEDCDVTVRANGVTIAYYHHVRSPDWNNTEADGIVNVADFAFFAGAFLSTQNDCADYNNNGSVNAIDFSLFAPAFLRQDRNPAGCAP
ncbi:MAG: hypothetical protein KJ970_20440 [Candidatus Eisenbacteria bacterium]|uniref:Dockerin domain-containing protein n=1 Tax=Eiseniibacteriota bacterium TaxID=2212470 RepID=A0A948W848_UNCEI|nr:hypothetical protein [Candidatus Eisenbacteria bacterium]